MTHPDHEPDVEFWRPEDRAAEKLQDEIAFEPQLFDWDDLEDTDETGV